MDFKLNIYLKGRMTEQEADPSYAGPFLRSWYQAGTVRIEA